MNVSSNQPFEFAIFFLAGVLSAAIYAVFWLIRHFFKPNGFWEIVCDLGFVLSSGGIFLLLITSEYTLGELKFFYFLAYLSSLLIALIVFGLTKDMILKAAKKIFKKIKKSKINNTLTMWQQKYNHRQKALQTRQEEYFKRQQTKKEAKKKEKEVRDQESGVRIQDSGFRIQDSGVRIQDSGVRIQGSGNRDQEVQNSKLKEKKKKKKIKVIHSGKN